jgi:hypothetical protein
MIAEELMKGGQGKEDVVGAGETFGWSDCNELGLDKLKVMKEVVRHWGESGIAQLQQSS